MFNEYDRLRKGAYNIVKLIAIIVGILLLFWLCSCNAIKRAEKKVLANPESVNKIGKVWERFYTIFNVTNGCFSVNCINFFSV